MFDIGFSELLVVFVVGLLILGPERLPHAAKTAGLWIRKIRRSINSVQREINAQLDQEELQQKINETNQRIMKEGETIQNTIPPLPDIDESEAANKAQTDVELEPIRPIQQEQETPPEQEQKTLLADYKTNNQPEVSNRDEPPPAAHEDKTSDANLSRS